ncbi:MAG: MFS transporter [Caulobacteraceae bacterium]
MEINRNYFLLCMIAFLQGFVFYGPIATIYRQSRGISIYQIFLIESIFMVLMVLFEIPWGWFADRFGYKTTLVISLFLSLVSKVVFYKAYSFGFFLLERILLALALSGMSGCDTAMLYNSIDESNSEKAFGRYYSLSTLGFLLATLSSTFVISYSMELAALYTIVPYGLSAAAALFLREVKAVDNERRGIVESLKTILNNKHMLVFVLAMAFISEVSHSVIVFLNQLQYQRSGINIRYFGIILAFMQLVSMLSAKSHVITGKIGQRKTIAGAFGVIAISCFVIAFVHTPAASIILIAFVSAGYSLAVPISSDIQNKSITTANRATILSAYAMVMDVVSSAVNLTIGKSANLSVQLSFEICAGIAVLALILAYKLPVRLYAGVSGLPAGRDS